MITGEKLKAITIIIHTLIKSRIKDNALKQENNIFALKGNCYNILNNDLLELIESLEKINLTKDILCISKGNIAMNRMVYYYSVGLKQIEKYNKTQDIFSSALLSILLLINLVEENQISKIKVDKLPSELFSLYLEQRVPSKFIKKMSILADKIYSEVSTANFSKMIKGRIRKKR